MLPPQTNELSRELAAYEKLLPSLAADDGRYALIAEDSLLGVYGTYLDALEAGYRERGLNPFLVKQIATIEIRPYFDRGQPS